MKQISLDLWQTQAEHPFAGVTSHAYLLTRQDGNVLFYGTGVHDELQHIKDHGGIVRQYLSHRDEAGSALADIKQAFGSELCCHSLEATAIQAYCPVDLTFDTYEMHLRSIEIIPTPGHTAGSTCFACRSSHGKKYLFTGDLIFPEGQSWGTLVRWAAGGRKADLRRSLKSLRDIQPDLVIASACMGSTPVMMTSGDQWRDIIDETVERL